jgi:elongation factor P
MASINATEIKKGMILEMDGGLLQVMDVYHQKLGKGGAVLQCKLRDIKRGTQVQKRIRSAEKVETAFLETKTMEYLYQDGDSYCFMDTENYDQVTLPSEAVGDSMNYILPNSQVRIVWHEGQPLSLELPASVTLEVIETEPGARGNTVTNVFKPAKLDTGFEIKVPMHINQGDKVKVDTRTGEFLGRE